MKKIFTLVFALGIVSLSFAQYSGNQKSYGHNNDVAYNDSHYKKDNGRFNDRSDYGKREMEMKIADINRNYDRKIQEVRSNWFMNRSKKERMIRTLEEQRKDEIRMAYAKFNNRHNRFDDNDRRH